MGERREAPENGGIADQHVEPAEALVEGRPERIDPLAVGQVEGDERGLAAALPDRVVDLLERLAGAGDEQHMRALPGKGERNGAADAARGPGDERDAVLEAFGRQPTSARKESCFCCGGPSRSRSLVGYSPVKQWSVNWGWAASRPSKPMAL